MQQTRERAERIARNDSTFRDANERIDDVAQTIDDYRGTLLPFLCECADLSCTDIVRLTGEEYEEVRRRPTSFLTVPGHEDDEATSVVEENDRFAVVEKVGSAAEIAVELDPRSAEGVRLRARR
jgi:hypothetical protein